MRQTKRIFGFFVVIAASFFYSCDEIYECIFNIEPEIHDKQLLIGVVGERYRDLITAEISNEVNDNDYDYFFDVIGQLPPGIFYDENRRSIELFGTPEEAGVYRFRVELFVESFDYNGFDSSPTCSESTIRDFTLQVLE